jgi:NAD-dependent SIR2 family protein deacetylase
VFREKDVGNEALFEVAAELIAQADSLIVSAGAGIGVDSGLPDFRGTTGFWSAYPSLAQDKVDFFRIACPDAFRSQPLRAWGFYGHRLNLYRNTTPHDGFQILKRWGENMSRGYAVFTSNVDGQFQKAGFDPATIHECHGSIHHLQCLEPCCSDIWSADGFNPEVDWDNCRLLNVPPKCPRCKGLARPNVLMFGDGEWLTQRQDKQAGRFGAWLAGVERPVVVEVGAGTSIPSVRRLSHQILQGFNGRLVRINPREFAVPTSMDVGLARDAGYALSAIDKLVRNG